MEQKFYMYAIFFNENQKKENMFLIYFFNISFIKYFYVAFPIFLYSYCCEIPTDNLQKKMKYFKYKFWEFSLYICNADDQHEKLLLTLDTDICFLLWRDFWICFFAESSCDKQIYFDFLRYDYFRILQ